jgi:hypothetical protein
MPVMAKKGKKKVKTPNPFYGMSIEQAIKTAFGVKKKRKKNNKS